MAAVPTLAVENNIWGPDWPSVRALWSIDPSRAHLNHGSFGAVPLAVQRFQDDLRKEVEANPMAWLSRTHEERINAARVAVASFLRADPGGFAFVCNATQGANAVLRSLPLGPGDEVLVTDHVYGAVRYAAARVCEERGARLVEQAVPLPRESVAEVRDAVLAGVTARTRLVVFDHISSPTALVFPVEELVAELRSRGVLSLVDGAHAPGMLNVDLSLLDPDFWTGNFHKWCCSPRGSGGLWVREEHRPLIRPLVTSWYIDEGYPASFRWHGTDDYTPWLSVPAALDFMAGLGWERVRAHNAALARYGRDAVTAALGTDPAFDPRLDGLAGSMTLVALPAHGSVASADYRRELQGRLADEHALETVINFHGGRPYLRLSAQVYNAPAEYDRVAEVLPRVLAARSG